MPVIGLALPSGDWREARFVMRTVTDAQGKVTESAITYGHLLGTIIDFIFIAFIVFLITRALLKPAPAEPVKKCPNAWNRSRPKPVNARLAGRQWPEGSLGRHCEILLQEQPAV